MKNLIICLILGTITLMNPYVYAQKDSTFTPKTGFFPEMSVTLQYPSADLAQRFGPHNTLGAGLYYKTSGNAWFGIRYQWMFGQNVRETNMLDSLASTDGYIFDMNGQSAIIRFFLRGHTAFAQGGKLIPLNKKKPDSGLLISAGLGYMIHKVYIFSSTTTVPQLSDAYKKGYDRLSGGPAANAFLGYLYLDPRKRVNVLAGFEFQAARTQSFRSFNYDTRTADLSIRRDQNLALHLGLIIPLYTKKKSEAEFFND